MTKQGLTWWLSQLYKIQKEILLVYRPTTNHNWTKRCQYLGENYSAKIPYNHRSILRNEIVIEFDSGSSEENRRCADIVAKRLSDNNIGWSKWTSGNKSTHVHTLLDIGDLQNVATFKRAFMRHFCSDLPLPDLQLAADNHLIRAECGVHEKTGRRKELISRSPEYPKLSMVPPTLWIEYRSEVRKNLSRRVTRNSTNLKAHKGFEYIITTHQFAQSGDGHERALFMLIQALKADYGDRKDELVAFLQDWYKYSGGNKLSPEEIRRKVSYGLIKDYTVTERYLEELLESIGVKL